MDCKHSEKLNSLFEEALNPSGNCIAKDSGAGDLDWVSAALLDIRNVVDEHGFSDVAKEIEVARLRIELLLRMGKG